MKALSKDTKRKKSQPVLFGYGSRKTNLTPNASYANLQLREKTNTTGMSLHLKRHHGFLSKNNAWKIFDKLSSLKDVGVSILQTADIESKFRNQWISDRSLIWPILASFVPISYPLPGRQFRYALVASKLDLLAPYGSFVCSTRGCRSCAVPV